MATEGEGLVEARACQHRLLAYRWWLPASICVAVISLAVVPDGLGYDPISWMIWGRELDHGTLVTAGAASSIKPLPVFVDFLLAPFGRAALDLWLVFARAGVVMALFLVYHLARSLAGRTAGVVAALGWLTTYQVAAYLYMEGMSEPLCAALVLAAVDAHMAARWRRAVVLGFAASLVRIEVWPFVVVYGLFILFKRQRASAAPLSGLVLLAVGALAMWFVPDAISSGNLLRSAAEAGRESQGGPLLSAYPGLSTFSEASGLPFWPLVVAFAAETAAGVVELARHRRARATLWLAGASLSYLVLEAVMAQLRVATGAPRYLLPAVSVAIVVAGAACADGLTALRRFWHRGRPHLVWGLGVGVLAAACLPNAIGWARTVQGSWSSTLYVQRLADEVPAAVAKLGGRTAVLRCGTISVAPLQNPAVAWALKVPLGDVGPFPAARGVVFSAGGQPRIPAQYAPGYRQVGTVGPPSALWVLLTTCPVHAG